MTIYQCFFPGRKQESAGDENGAGGYSITSVARTVLKVLGAPGEGLEADAAAADERVLALAPAGGVKKLLIYAPDAIDPPAPED